MCESKKKPCGENVLYVNLHFLSLISCHRTRLPAERRYNVVFMFLTYFLPIGSMTFTYARVGIELWGSQSIGECTQRQLDNIKSKRRVSTLTSKIQYIAYNIRSVLWHKTNSKHISKYCNIWSTSRNISFSLWYMSINVRKYIRVYI